MQIICKSAFRTKSSFNLSEEKLKNNNNINQSLLLEQIISKHTDTFCGFGNYLVLQHNTIPLNVIVNHSKAVLHHTILQNKQAIFPLGLQDTFHTLSRHDVILTNKQWHFALTEGKIKTVIYLSDINKNNTHRWSF